MRRWICHLSAGKEFVKRKIKGFTLIELIVVISIISILSTVGIVTYSNIQNKVKDAKKKADINAIAKAFEIKYGTNGYGDDLTPNSNNNLFASGTFPKPPEGGDYTILRNDATTGFAVCAPLSGNTPCSAPSGTCFCKTSAQAEPPVLSSTSKTYITNIPSPSPVSVSVSSVFDSRFASAGWAGLGLDLYYYNWNDMSGTPPNQLSQNHKFARIIGKLNDRSDNLDCKPCNQANVDSIFNAESPKIQNLLNNSVNKGGVWIVGNEGNLNPDGPYLEPSVYAYQFTKYYTLIKGLDPSAKLANTGLLYFMDSVNNATSYLSIVIANLGSIRPDIYNVHFYPGWTFTQNYFDLSVQKAREFKNYVSSVDPGKPIWVTEFGINSTTTALNVKQYMYTMLNYLESEPQYQKWFWFIGSADPNWTYTALSINSQLTEVGNYYKAWAQNGPQSAPIISSPSPSPSASLQPAVNLLTNGGFENLSGWVCFGAISGSCAQSGPAFTGSYSVSVVNTGGSWGWQLAQGGINASPFEQFCLSAQVKKQNASDIAAVAIQETGGNYQGQAVIYAPNATNWQLVKSTVTVGSNWVLPIQVFLRTVNVSSALFDDVSLSRGPC